MTTENYTPQFTEDDTPRQDPTFAPSPSDKRINPGSPLEVLRAAVTQDVEAEDLVLKLPSRPIVKMVFNTNIDGEKFQMWQRAARRRGKSTAEDMDMLKFSATILANQCKGIRVTVQGKDQDALGSDGEPINFQHHEFREMLLRGNDGRNVTTIQLVRDLFGNDGQLLNAAKEVIIAAGYIDDVDEFAENPTDV